MDLVWSSSSKIYWLYLCFAALVAVVIYVRTAGAPSVRGALAFLFPKAVFTHPSAVADYKLWIVNGILFVVLYFPYLGLSLLTAANATLGGLRAISGLSDLC